MRMGLCSSSSVFLWTALSRREYLVSRCMGLTRMSISLRRLQSRCVSHHLIPIAERDKRERSNQMETKKKERKKETPQLTAK